MKYVAPDAIENFARDIFRSLKCPRSLSQPVIEGLIETALRGVDSHGIRLIPHYAEAVLIGRINISPQWKFRKTSSVTGLLDADHTFGIAAAQLAMQKSIQLAKRAGIGCTVVYNSTHFGAAAIYSLLAAREDMLGLSLTNTDALVLPHASRKKFLGTNPICLAAPCAGEEPFCLDMSTSVISWNNLRQHRQAGKFLQDGWAADKKGRMTRDPFQAYGLLPIGGYKGFGLGLVVEILCSLLAGMPYGRHISEMYPLNKKKRRLAHFLMAIDVGKFQEISAFKRRMKKFLTEIRSLPPASGHDRVRVANDIEKEFFRERSKKGIPFTKADVLSFRRAGENLQLDFRKHSFLNAYN